jgi:hypothetical protein
VGGKKQIGGGFEKNWTIWRLVIQEGEFQIQNQKIAKN